MAKRLVHSNATRSRAVPIHLLAAVVAAAAVVASNSAPRAQGGCTGCLKARYWRVASDDWTKSGEPDFPERDQLKNVPSVGIAFSGGGTRSATATLGQLRGMNQNGWLDRVRYVSAVSGGSWASIPFAFSTLSLDELLGAFELPGQLKLADVKDTPNGALARAIANSSLTSSAILETSSLVAQANASKDILLAQFLNLTNSLRREPDRVDKTYTRLIGKTFIDPLIEPGGATSDKLFTWDDRSLGEMSSAGGGRLGNFVIAHPHRPFLIASGTVVSSRRDYVFPLLMPVEYTPLYVGVRQQFGGRFGGAYVWPWAYDPAGVGALEPDSPGAGTGTIEVQYDQRHHFTLADVAGSSGAAPELLTITGGPVPERLKAQVQLGAQVFPAFRHIAIQNDSSAVLTGLVAHADGGAGDNLAVMPLLARQTKNVLVFVNTSTQWAETNDDLRSLFVPIGPPSSDGDRRHNVVFTAELYKKVREGLIAAREAHSPQVFCDTNWPVQSNKHYNIRGYSGLNICFFYNASAAEWERLLPDAVKPLIKDTNFPWFATFEQNKPHVIQLEAAQVNLLANLTAWTMTNEATVRKIRDAIPAFPCPPSLRCTP